MTIDVTAQEGDPSSLIEAPGQHQRAPSESWRDEVYDEPLLPRPASSQADLEETSTSRQCTWDGARACAIVALLATSVLAVTCRRTQGCKCRLVWNSGVFCMGIAALIQSLAALLVKLTDGRVPVFELVAIRSGLCMAATLVLVKMRGISPIFGSPSNLPALLIRGFAGAASMSMYYFAIFILPLADVITLFYAHPAMVVALAWLCKGELVGALGVLGMLASLLGVMFVAQPPFLTGGSTWSTQQLTGVGLCVGAAFLAAVAFVAIRFVPKTESSFSIALWFHIAGFVGSAIPLLAGWPQGPVLPSPMDMAMMVAIATCSFSSHALIARAFLMDNAGKVSAAGYLQVVFAHLYGIALLHDPESLFGVLGSLVICIGVVAVSWPANKPKDTMAASKFDLIQYSTIPEESTTVEMAPMVADISGRQSMDKAAERKDDLRV